MPHPFKESLSIVECFFGGNTVKTEHYLKNIRKYDKTNLNNNFVENFNMSFKHRN